MKNVWKGLVVGALVGGAVGVVLDLLGGGSGRLKTLGRRVHEQAPAAAEWASSVAGMAAERGAGLLADAQVPDRVRDAARKIGDSGLADQAKGTVADAVAKGKDVAADAVAKGKDVAGDAVAKGKDVAAGVGH
ncbi:MAG TPA: hypothetical protein VHW47_03080 [Acidimicrobiales bacterium]|nr:hypothetical protein [Acidimicrobiales bacterium]